MELLNVIKDLETIESSLGHIALLTKDKTIKHQFFLARKSIHKAICNLLEEAPEHD